MQCYVYKGTTKEDHFLYLPVEFDTDNPSESIPKALLEVLGDLLFVVEFDLVETRKLPNADAKQVLSALSDQGFYFQMPNDTMYDNEEHYFN